MFLPACNMARGVDIEEVVAPTVTPVVNIVVTDEGFKVAYPKIKLLTNEGIIEDWPQDFEIPGRPDFDIKKGEPIYIIIENTNLSDIDLNLSYIVPDSVTSDNDTGYIYVPAPEGIIVKLYTNQITISPQSISRIPFRIEIPKIKDIPSRWEFDIHVTDANPGFVAIAENQRWLITMR